MKHGFHIVAMILALGLCLAARTGAQTTAEDFWKSGDEKLSKGDLDGALADYNHAIELDPKDAAVYSDRGTVKQYKGDDDGAIADWTRAIELDPTNPDAYRDRGISKYNKGDPDGAITDLAKALKINNEDATAYECLGAARQTKGDTDGALADLDRSVSLEPKNPEHYTFRGAEKMRLGKWADALADFRLGCELPADGDSVTYQDYGHILIWVIRSRLGEMDAATKELSDYFAKRNDADPGTWCSKIAGFLTGSVGEADLAAGATAAYKIPDPDRRCEVWYYAGMKKFFAGDKKGAAEYFHKCLDSNRRGAVENQLAVEELKTLGQ